MDTQLHAEHCKLWESRALQKELEYNCDEGCFPRYKELRDVMGDHMDEYSDTVATELKSLALWGGDSHYQPALMAYNDYKFADAVLGGIKLDNHLITGHDYTHTLQFAHLIAVNRQTLVHTKQLKRIDVTESDRQETALECYKNRSFFLKHPPKKALTAIMKRLELTDSIEGNKRQRIGATRDKLETKVQWDEFNNKFVTRCEWLGATHILDDLTDIYKDLLESSTRQHPRRQVDRPGDHKWDRYSKHSNGFAHSMHYDGCKPKDSNHKAV